MKGFCRMTKLTNVGGRADYIRDPDRQEEVVVSSEAIDWQPYHAYEMANQKSDKKNNEGRELIISIPNEWYTTISRKELTNRVEQIVYAAVGKKTDVEWAVHWNKRRTNLHIHAVFSERSRIVDPGKWDRDIYLTNDGRVARKKADRATFDNGEVKPPVHRKGDLKEPFTAKNKAYKSRSWLKTTKETTKGVLRSYGAVIERDGFVHQYHEGKGTDSSKIRKKNEVIKANNATYETVLRKFPKLEKKKLKKYLIKAANEFRLVNQHELKDIIKQSMSKADRLQMAFEDLKSAKAKVGNLRYDISKCHFWERSKKQQLSSELSNASVELQKALNEVFSYGISKYREQGVELSARLLDSDDMQYLERRVEWTVTEMKRKEDHEARIASNSFNDQEIREARRKMQERADQVRSTQKSKSTGKERD